jgi:PAS domain S-box-containing protein
MKEVDLAQIMFLPEVSSIITRFAETFDSVFSITAKDGSLLLGRETEGHPASYPIECDGSVIGWVSGNSEAALLASRISYAAECEHEKQTLTRRIAQQGGPDAVMKHMEEYFLHFDQAPDVIYTTDTDFRIVSISASVKKHLGYLPEELTGKPFPELGLLSEESLARAVTDSMRIFNGEPVVSAEYELIAKDGTIKIAEMRNASIYKDGKVSLVVAVARDITDKKKAERALELSELRFRSMAENINDGLMIV